MIKLPKGSFTVKRDDDILPTASTSLIITQEDLIPKKANSGEIVFTCDHLKQYQGCKVYFREAYSEEIEIHGIKLLFFRDLDSSIYYIEIDDKRPE